MAGYRGHCGEPAEQPPSEMEILRRVVEQDQPLLSEAAARAILRLGFSRQDPLRMHRLAARNREGQLSRAEEEELNNYIRVGQTLGILQSKARRSSKQRRKPQGNDKVNKNC